VPAQAFPIVIWWSIRPAIVTFCLLAFRSSRRFYGLQA